jgi:hypothetical protein
MGMPATQSVYMMLTAVTLPEEGVPGPGRTPAMVRVAMTLK